MQSHGWPGMGWAHRKSAGGSRDWLQWAAQNRMAKHTEGSSVLVWRSQQFQTAGQTVGRPGYRGDDDSGSSHDLSKILLCLKEGHIEDPCCMCDGTADKIEGIQPTLTFINTPL